MPPVGKQNTARRRGGVRDAVRSERLLADYLSSLDNDAAEAFRRVGVLEAVLNEGCCPGEWNTPTLESPWMYADEDCPFMYRWGPFRDGQTVDDAGLEFTGQVVGGTSGSVLFVLPFGDIPTCGKDFPMLYVTGPSMAYSHIDVDTGEVTVFFPI